MGPVPRNMPFCLNNYNISRNHKRYLSLSHWCHSSRENKMHFLNWKLRYFQQRYLYDTVIVKLVPVHKPTKMPIQYQSQLNLAYMIPSIVKPVLTNKHHTIKKYEGVEVKCHRFFTSALGSCELLPIHWSFIPGERTQLSLKKLVEPQLQWSR